LQQVAGTLKELDATIVAISPQLAEASRSLIEQQKISFDLLPDPGNAYAEHHRGQHSQRGYAVE
jgi:peroxiredoxin